MERLHIGGEEAKAGWKILNIQPDDIVDFVGDVQDLSQFDDASWDEIYASHVLEHVHSANFLPTLKGLHRILKPGGKIMISVPDLEVLCWLYIHPQFGKEARFQVMRMMFGGQEEPFDVHYIGLSFELLSDYLTGTGFTRIERVQSFGLFNDTSELAPYGGVPISLNVLAFRGD